MPTNPWPNDPEFQRFAAKIADAVQVALSNGWRIGRDGTEACCCPLGAVVCKWSPNAKTPVNLRFPTWLNGFSVQHTGPFWKGFDKERARPYLRRMPAYRLGVAYRERFAA